MPCYLPVMQYADNRELRATLHRAYATRASELGAKPEWDNAPGDRAHPRAAPRGRAAARLSRTTPRSRWCRRWRRAPPRCSRSCATSRAARRPFAERDYAELAAFARDELGLAELAPGTSPTRRRSSRRSATRSPSRRCASTSPRTRCSRACSASSRRSTASRSARAGAPTWHPTCASSTSPTPRARWSASSTSTSTRARASRAARGWTTRSTAAASARAVQHPVAYLTCNLSAPVGGKPATFTHDEVITLFHEFGHGLHQLLTRVDVAGVSGIQGVEWDAVELPSQFMENFCWEWDVLAHMTAHVDTGAPLPRALFDRMLAAKNFQSGMATVAPARVRPVRHAAARGLRPARRRVAAGGARRRAARGRGRAAGALRPLHAVVRAHLRRRLRGRLLQLQVGRGAVGRRLSACSRRRACCRPPPARGSATRCWPAAAAATRWSRSSPSAAARPNSTRFCGIMG